MGGGEAGELWLREEVASSYWLTISILIVTPRVVSGAPGDTMPLYNMIDFLWTLVSRKTCGQVKTKHIYDEVKFKNAMHFSDKAETPKTFQTNRGPFKVCTPRFLGSVCFCFSVMRGIWCWESSKNVQIQFKGNSSVTPNFSSLFLNLYSDH